MSVARRRPIGRSTPAALALGMGFWTAVPLAAQGVTGAAIGGRVLTLDSIPVDQARVHVVNASNGERWQTTTNARGRYFIEYLSVGGPYRIEVLAIGYGPAQRDSIFLALGQRSIVDFALSTAVLQLQEITVTSAVDERLSSERTGPAQTISANTISRLPVDHRDYTELAILSPQVTKNLRGGLSFAGQHDRFNSIQIDGTNNNDPFGKRQSGNGTPGWAVGLMAFTPEAVKELRVVSAPFDVRYGSFSGGLINAVTQSASNRVEGSILGYLESSDLTGTDSTGSRASEFNRKEFGLTVGAPIIRNRVWVFVNADIRREVLPQLVPVPTSDTTGGADSAGVGIRYESLVRFQDLLRGYGVEPGSFAAGPLRTPTRNLFMKVSAQLGVNSRLAVSHNYGHGNARNETADRNYGFYPLSSAADENPETINATRLAWTTAFAHRFSNQLILARVDDRRTCLPNSSFPRISLYTDGGVVEAGAKPACGGLETGHTTWEFTDNVGVAAGNHRLTLGTHGERMDLVDDVVIYPAGVWDFGSLDSLERGEAQLYIRDSSAAPDSRLAFRVNQIGVYLQDQWQPGPRLSLTAGLRLDVPYVPKAPTRHPAALRELGINTSLTPSGNVLWSPRLGINYDMSGRGTTLLRGGAGLFAGHPAYVWFRNVYGYTGVRALRIECVDDAVPDFTLDPGNQPSECAEPTPTTFPVAYFDPDFRFPRSLKVALGADHLLPGGIVGTLDVLYTRGINTVHAVDVNLVGPVEIAAGEGGRPIYGMIDPTTGEALPTRRSDSLGGVYQLQNGSGDRSFSVTVQLGKRFGNGTEMSAAYTYTDAQDRMSMDANIADVNASSTPVDGTLEHRQLRTSVWERPHKVTLVATTDLPFGFQFGLTYIGISGAPFSYVSLGDPNADGFQPFDVSNDLVYVPRDADDITMVGPDDYAELESFIRDEPCLRTQRGRLLQRNSCRNPWVHETQARLSKRFQLAGRRALEVTADLFNVMNFLDSDWGLVRETAGGFAVPLLDFVGYDTLNHRGVYGLWPVYRRQIDVNASRWRLQLGGTFSF